MPRDGADSRTEHFTRFNPVTEPTRVLPGAQKHSSGRLLVHRVFDLLRRIGQLWVENFVTVSGYQDRIFHEEALAGGAEEWFVANDVAFLEDLWRTFCHVHAKTVQRKAQVLECVFCGRLPQRSLQSSLALLDVT